MSPNGRYSNKINHTLVNERFANNIIMDVRTYCVYCVDHFLVVSNLRVKLKTMSRKIRLGIVRYDVEKLKDNRKCKDFTRSALRS